MTVWRWEAAGVACLVGLQGCGKAESPRLVLDRPEATLSRTFQQVSNVVELSDGRIALAELKDKTFLFADFKTGETTPIGEHADTIRPDDPAPGRHKLPGYVLRLGGDTVGLIDFAAERTTLWNEAGQYLTVLGAAGVGGHNQAVNYDARGNRYKEDVRSVLGGLEPGRELMFDSLSVLRIPPGDTVADTIAKLKLPPWGRGQFGEQVKMVSMIFAGRDLFGVLPDGSLWIARASNNAVDWLSPSGQWTRGRGRRFSKIAVPQEEKDTFLGRLREQMARMGAPAGIELSYPFADENGPFISGVTNPSGEVWLERPRAWGDSIPVWDVVGRDSKEVRVVQLPKASSVVGFGGDGRVYVLLRDGDGRQRVARYVLR
jgi:hypothetical protein